MSFNLSDHTGKENLPLEEINNFANSQNSLKTFLQDDPIKLEKLYSEQVLKLKAAYTEQENLEVELEDRNSFILLQKKEIKKLNDTNKSLSDKFDNEISYYESQLQDFQNVNKEWNLKFNKLHSENSQLQDVIKLKNEEIDSLNQELEKSIDALKSNRHQVESLSRSGKDGTGSFVLNTEDDQDSDNDSEIDPSSYRKLDLSFDDSFNDDSLNGLLSDEDEDYEKSLVLEIQKHAHNKDNSLSLAEELNNKLSEKERDLKSLEFEIRSLKHEKTQLYDYINKLLRNPTQPDQNEILKQKLLTRKILRVTSASHGGNLKLENSKLRLKTKTKNRRVISNYVSLKSYSTKKNKRYTKLEDDYEPNYNSDNDKVSEDDILYERWLLGYVGLGHKILGIVSGHTLKPTSILLKHNKTKRVPQYEACLSEDNKDGIE